MIWPLLALAAIALAGIAYLVWAYRFAMDGSWHFHNGRMRRFVGGRWEYRELTEEEVAEDVKWRPW